MAIASSSPLTPAAYRVPSSSGTQTADALAYSSRSSTKLNPRTNSTFVGRLTSSPAASCLAHGLLANDHGSFLRKKSHRLDERLVVASLAPDRHDQIRLDRSLQLRPKESMIDFIANEEHLFSREFCIVQQVRLLFRTEDDHGIETVQPPEFPLKRGFSSAGQVVPDQNVATPASPY